MYAIRRPMRSEKNVEKLQLQFRQKSCGRVEQGCAADLEGAEVERVAEGGHRAARREFLLLRPGPNTTLVYAFL